MPTIQKDGSLPSASPSPSPQVMIGRQQHMYSIGPLHMVYRNQYGSQLHAFLLPMLFSMIVDWLVLHAADTRQILRLPDHMM